MGKTMSERFDNGTPLRGAKMRWYLIYVNHRCDSSKMIMEEFPRLSDLARRIEEVVIEIGDDFDLKQVLYGAAVKVTIRKNVDIQIGDPS